MAHSLGSVLCFDILCNQPHLFAALPRPPSAASPQEQPQPKRPRHAPSDAQVAPCICWPICLCGQYLPQAAALAFCARVCAIHTVRSSQSGTLITD